MNIKEKWASIFIPKNSPYCHHRFKPNKKYGMSAKPCRYWHLEKMSYCEVVDNPKRFSKDIEKS